MNEYPNIPPHIRAWMETEDGWQQVIRIVLDVLNGVTNVVTTAEVREVVEEAYRRAHGGSIPVSEWLATPCLTCPEHTLAQHELGVRDGRCIAPGCPCAAPRFNFPSAAEGA